MKKYVNVNLGWLRGEEGEAVRNRLLTAKVSACGCRWYDEARFDIMGMAFDLRGIGLDRMSKVVSVLSPRCEWEQNLENADRAVRAWCDGGLGTLLEMEGLFANRGQRMKVDEILRTGDCRMGLKTRAFANCLAGSRKWYDFVIDRHMLAIALGRGDDVVGEYKISSDAFYRELAGMYVWAAGVRGVNPVRMQAGMWVYYRWAQGEA